MRGKKDLYRKVRRLDNIDRQRHKMTRLLWRKARRALLRQIAEGGGQK